jgi:DNA-nicking Smr family endonuclease
VSKKGSAPKNSVARGDDPGEDAAFLEAMRGAERLKGPTRVAPGTGSGRRRHPAVDARIRAAVRPPAGIAGAGLGSPAFAVEEAGETWTARANGIDRRFTSKLRSGDLPVEARIDLHGRSREEALRALERFVTGAVAGGRRCVLVIHGRGLHSSPDGPTLRDAVREALIGGATAGHALAASSAPAALGGAGATLVWLRKAPPETNR